MAPDSLKLPQSCSVAVLGVAGEVPVSCWGWLTGTVLLPGPLEKGEVVARKDASAVVLEWPADICLLLFLSVLLQQPWCSTVLTDLVMVTTVYFSSACSLEESGRKDR